MSAIPHALGRRSVLRAGLAGALGLAGASLLSACGGPAADGPTAKLEDVQAGTAGAVIRPIAEQNGLLGDLTPDWVGGTGPGDVQNKLLSGALDAASMGPLGAAVAGAAGADLVLISNSLNNHVRWLVPANSPYRTPADLRGKRVATPPNNSDAFRSAQLAAAVNGSDLTADHQLFPGAVLAGLALFDRGDVEGIITIEPNATRLVARGARQIATVGELWARGTGEDPNTLVLNGQGVTRAWLEANQPAARAIASMRMRAHQVVHDRPQVLADLHESYGIPASEPAAIALLPQRMRDVYPLTWGEPVFVNLRRQLQVAAQVGLVRAAPAREPWVDLGAGA
ncbi:ABC transporter substrate-binding protein [Actinomycetospora sp. OC33-EN08]|uniref:ABC transporter substrate-binding protein n=1 Tax=Actinomycetospora aurantiaca TaxID=3129233 RepID=A0ABU8MIR5_9PSEU